MERRREELLSDKADIISRSNKKVKTTDSSGGEVDGMTVDSKEVEETRNLGEISLGGDARHSFKVKLLGTNSNDAMSESFDSDDSDV